MFFLAEYTKPDGHSFDSILTQATPNATLQAETWEYCPNLSKWDFRVYSQISFALLITLVWISSDNFASPFTSQRARLGWNILPSTYTLRSAGSARTFGTATPSEVRAKGSREARLPLDSALAASLELDQATSPEICRLHTNRGRRRVHRPSIPSRLSFSACPRYLLNLDRSPCYCIFVER